jgi:hypothetical protein
LSPKELSRCKSKAQPTPIRGLRIHRCSTDKRPSIWTTGDPPATPLLSDGAPEGTLKSSGEAGMNKSPAPDRNRLEDAPRSLPTQLPHVGRSPELFFPYNVHRYPKRTIAGIASSDWLRPQVFSTSRRLYPPVSLRAYCIPVPFMGLMLFKGFPSQEAEHLSTRHAPPDIGAEAPASRGLSNLRIRAYALSPVKG